MLGSKLKKSKIFEASLSFFPQKFNVVCVNLLQSYSNHLLGIGKIVIFKLEDSAAFVIDKNDEKDCKFYPL